MLFAQLSQLTHLQMSCSSHLSLEITGRDAQSLACLVNLRKLTWDSVRIPATAYMHLTGINSLTILRCTVWQDEILLLTQLQTLCLKANQICFPGQAVSNLSRLSHLELTTDVPYRPYAPFNIKRLQKLPALRTLLLRIVCGFDQWNKLPDLSQVRTLHLRNVATVTEEVFGWLMTMKQLTSLTVHAGSIIHASSSEERKSESMKSMSCLEYMGLSLGLSLIPKFILNTARAMVEDVHHPMKSFAFVDRNGKSVCL